METRSLEAFVPALSDEESAEFVVRRRRFPALLRTAQISIEGSLLAQELEESRKHENDPLFFDDNPVTRKFALAITKPDPDVVSLRLGSLIIRAQQFASRAR